MQLFLVSVLFALTACESEEGVKAHNAAPQVTITSHVDGDMILANEVTSFRASLSDDSHSLGDLQAQWTAADRVICPFLPPDSEGVSTCEAVVNEGEGTIRVEVRDPKNATAVDELNLTVIASDAPFAEIVSPTQSSSYYNDQLIFFSAVIGDNEDEVTELKYSWESNIDGVLTLDDPPESSGEIEGYTYLSEGQHAVSLTVEDSSGKTTTESLTIMVGGPNSEPQCAIQEPNAGAVFVVGQTISFAATASDDDINNSLLSIRWESDQDGVFNTTAPTTDGALGFSYDGLSVGNHSITLTVEDEVGGICSTAVQLAIGQPPSLELHTPIHAETYTLGEPILFTATVADAEDIPSDITLSWNSDIQGEFSTQGADSSGSISFVTTNLQAGFHSLDVTATDTTGLTASTALSLHINTPPGSPTVSITPNPANTGQDLVATTNGTTDADGDNISFSYEWYKNGVVTSYMVASVPSSATQAGEIWTVRVTPNDGYTDGNYTEASIVIANSAPSIDSIAVSPTSGYNDTTFTCSASASDADQTVTPTYAWTVGNSTYNGASLDLSTTNAMPGDVLTCTASVQDDAGESASSSTSVTLSNRDPVLSSTSIDNMSPVANSTLTCAATVTDDDGEAITPSYTWSVGGATVGSQAVLILNTSMVEVGDAVVCTVSASDSYGGSVSGSVTATVQNSEPVMSAVTITPATDVSATDLVNCEATASDLDDGVLNPSYEWHNNTTGASLGTSAALQLDTSLASPGDIVGCTASFADSDGATVSASATVTIINTAPEFLMVATITPAGDAFTGDTLTCAAVANDGADGIITPTYEWSVGATVVETGDTYTVDATDSNVGDSLVCTALAVDSDGESTSSSATVTIQNTEPVLAGTAISPLSGVYNDTMLSCNATVTDPDESLGALYSWSVGAVQVANGATLDLATTAALPNDMVYCTAAVTDTEGASDAVTVSVVVENRAPSAPVISISPTSPIAGDSLFCQLDTVSVDPDGESVSYGYAWSQNGQATGYVSDTIPNNVVATGEVWTCAVTPSDSSGAGAVATSTVTILSEDSDGDGVLDADDVCPGFDDNLDANNNQIPDDCETSSSFGYTGAVQNFTVPAGVTSVFVEAWGAQGGHRSGYSTGGYGGYAEGVLSVTPGETLYIYVGEYPGANTNNNSAGWNGGGIGDKGTCCEGGAGGGASDVRQGATDLNSRMIVAGGGGGGGGMHQSWLTGGAGGGTIADAGLGDCPGAGGEQNAGGVRGIDNCNSDTSTDGVFGVGGDGGSGGCGLGGGGGGGGGWYGGGGGGGGSNGSCPSGGSAGGGGSSYIGGVLFGSVNHGIQSGAGQVIITYAQ